MTDPETIRIAVALITDERQRVLLVWNENWQAFTLPMTKIESGPLGESPENAALRAAAEAVRLPVRLIAGQTSKDTRKLQLSRRNKQIKNYVYTVARVELHPDFKSHSLDSRPVVWGAVPKIEGEEYHPLSGSVRPILAECREWGWF